MDSKSKTALSLILCSLAKACLCQTAHLGACSIRQMYLEIDLGFCESEHCVHPHQTLLCHLDLLIPDLCFVCCARSATCIVRPCAKEVTLLLDCR